MQEIRVVLSGFNPYGDVDVNPSYEVPKVIAEHGVVQPIGFNEDDDDFLSEVGLSIKAVSLPISFQKAWPRLLETIEEFQADIIIATGLKHAARGVLLERCATNQMDMETPVSGSAELVTALIDPEGPAAYWTRLPLRAILHEFNKQGIAATLSSDAGTFVCNSLFYNLLNWTATQKHKLSGFVSLPVIDESPHSQHGLALDQQILACSDVVCQTVHYYLQASTQDMLLA